MHTRPQVFALSSHAHRRHGHYGPAHTASDVLSGLVAIVGIAVIAGSYLVVDTVSRSPTYNHALCDDAKAKLSASMYMQDSTARTALLTDAYRVLYNPACR